MRIEILNSFSENKWLDFISSNRNSSIFHHPQWFKVLEKQYNFKPFVIACLNSNNEITAGMPFCAVKSIGWKVNWISLPFSDYCEPLFSDYEGVEYISEYLISLQKNREINSVEIRGGLVDGLPFAKKIGFIRHVIELPTTTQVIFEKFERTKKQQVRKAEKMGLTSIVEESMESIDKFYYLHLQTRKKLGVPIQPKSFFEILFKEIIETHLGFVILTYLGKEPIGAGIFMAYGNNLLYKYSAYAPNKVNFCPNHLTIWTAIKEGIRRRYKSLDFGRTEIENQGLLKFKSGWATNETELPYYYYPQLNKSYKTNTIRKSFISPIIKGSPAILCRLVGEIAYKHFP